MKENPAEHFSGKVAQKALIERDGKILLCRGVGDDKWELPGGRLHKDEEPAEGLAREVKEELDIDVNIGQPFYICRTYHFRDKYYCLLVTYRCSVVSGELKPDGEEIEEIRWVSREDISDLSIYDWLQDALKVYFDVR